MTIRNLMSSGLESAALKEKEDLRVQDRIANETWQPVSVNNKFSWNLEVEVAKVIEMGVALGLLKSKETEAQARKDNTDSDNVVPEELTNLEEVVFCNVYAPFVESEREELWQFLLVAQQTFTASWCVRGDFNTVMDSAERVGESSDVCSMRRFNSFILRMGVVDIPLHGSRFKWSNNKEEEARARLDSFLLSSIILSWYPSFLQKSLPWSLP
ncbi:hypothetical protein Dsin_023968 [Dipteronia sinensis]|uniref:Endonuclease/exonuclease/phosphatase domain-containing protein n=1 Tax=Dipteronia sinensis TaxID=43782 RepID=A0AAE0A4N3_9ROSI|nr:hypothetical protein Dsin_023968 [Dipteronia sinensis]